MLAEGRREREFLMKELDSRGDSYRSIPVTNPFAVGKSNKENIYIYRCKYQTTNV